MVAKAGRYFRHPFKGYRGVMQGDPLSSMIFNMVVDAVICHWVTVVMPTEAGRGGIGQTIIDLEAYFYADDGIVALNQPERLWRAYDVLTGLFDRVGLKTNTAKMVSMVRQSCHAPGGMLEEA